MAQAIIRNNKKVEITKPFTYLDYTIFIRNSSLNLCSYTFCKVCKAKMKMLYCDGYIMADNIQILVNPGHFKVDHCNCSNRTKEIKVIFVVDDANITFPQNIKELPFYKELPFQVDEELKQYLLPFLLVKI